jgi:hypothetical protein
VREGDTSGPSPSSKIFTKLINKNAVMPNKGLPSPKKVFTTFMYPPSKNFAKWIHPLDFQTVLIYALP